MSNFIKLFKNYIISKVLSKPLRFFILIILKKVLTVYNLLQVDLVYSFSVNIFHWIMMYYILFRIIFKGLT